MFSTTTRVAQTLPLPPATGSSFLEMISIYTASASAKRLERGGQSCLLAQLVGCDSIEDSLSLNRDCAFPICINRVLLPFAQLRVSVLLKILDQIAAFYRHLLDLDRNLFEEPPTRRDFFLKFAVRRDHFLG